MNTTLSHLIWAFANSIWQSALIAGVAWSVLALARRTSAALRCIVWSSVLVAIAVLPVLNAAMPAAVVRIAAPAASAAAAHPARSALNPEHRTMHSPALHVVAPDVPMVSAPAASAHVRFNVAQIADAAAAPAPPAQRIAATLSSTAAAVEAWLGAHAGALIVAWAAISGLLLVRLGVGFGRLRAIKSGLNRIEGEAIAERCRATARPVFVGESHDVDCPCVIGYARPVVALPAALVRSLDERDLDKVLAHELAHVRRFDDWGNLFAQALRALWFVNPVVHFAAHRLDVDREIACDDLVAENRDDRLDYAKCLTEIARRTTFGDHLVPAVGFFPDRKQIVVRIEQLLDRNHAGSARVGAVPAISAIAIGVLIVALARHQVPAFAQAISAPVATSTPSSAPVSPAVRAHAPAAPVVPAAQAAPKPVVAPDASAEMAHLAARLRALDVHDHGYAVRLSAFAEREAAMAARMHAFSVRAIHPYARVDAVAMASAVAALRSAQSYAVVAPAALAIRSDSRQDDSTGAFLDALDAAGYKNLSIDTLIRLRDSGVTTQYLRALKAYGMAPMPVDKLIEAANAGVDPDYLAGLAKYGYNGLSVDSAISLANAGVNTAYVAALAKAGYSGMSVDALRSMANAGVSPDYVAGLAKDGYARMSVDSLVRLANSGVTPSYVKSLSDLGYTGVSVDDLIRMADAGVSADMIRSLRAHGFMDKGNPSIDTLIKLANAGF